MTLLYIEHVKPQSHLTKFPLRQCKTGPTQYELVRRRRNAVETDKDVMRSIWSWLTWVNFEHVKKKKKRNEDLIESGRSKDTIRT